MSTPQGLIPLAREVVDSNGKMTQAWAYWLKQLAGSSPAGTGFVIDSTNSTYGQMSIGQGVSSAKGTPGVGDIYFAIDTGQIFVEEGGLWVEQTAALIGDVTKPLGSDTTTLATVNSNPGVWGNTSTIPVLTVNAKGLITSVSTVPVTAAVSAAGPSMSVQFNSGGSLAGDAALLYNTALSQLQATNIRVLGAITFAAPLATLNNLSPLTTKGDLLGFDGTNNIRVGVGADTYVLTADSTATSGFSWKISSGQTPFHILGTETFTVQANKQVLIAEPITIDAGGSLVVTGDLITVPTSGGTVSSVDVSGGSTGLTTSGGPVTGSGVITLSGTLGIANGGTASTTAQAALNTLAGVTANRVLRADGTNVTLSQVALGTDVTGNLPVANLNSGSGASASTYWRGDGTWAAASGGGGITALTGDVTASGSGSVPATIALGNRHEWTATQNVAQVSLTDASTITPNGALSNNFYLLTTSAIGASRTMNIPSSLNAGDIVNIEVVQPSTGGPCAITWASGYKWGLGGQGSAPAGSTVASASDFYSFICQNNGNLHGAQINSGATAGENVNLQTGTTYTYLNSDNQTLVSHTNASAIAATLPQAGASSQFLITWWMDVQNRGAGTLTITPTTSTIDGAASLALTTGQGCRVVSDGTNYYTQRGIGGGSNPLTTTGDMIYSSSGSTQARLPIGTTGQILTVAGGIPSWATGGAGSSPLTTKGDLYTYSTTNARLPVGTDGQYLKADSTATTGNSWATLPTATNQPYAFRAYRSTTQSIPSATFTKLQLTSKYFDTGNAFDNVTNYRFQPLAAGYYQINAGLSVSMASNAEFSANIYKNGSIYSSGADFQNIVSTGTRSTITDTVFLNGSTDYVELWCYCGAAATTQTGSNNIWFSGTLVAGTLTGVPTVSYTGSGSGDISITSTSFVDLTGYTASIAASVGDILECEVNGTAYMSSGSVPQTPQICFNVAGTDLTAQGSPNFSYSTLGFVAPVICRIRRTVVAGDISGGLVTIKVRVKLQTGSSTLIWNNSSTAVGMLTVKNFGDGSGVPAKGSTNFRVHLGTNFTGTAASITTKVPFDTVDWDAYSLFNVSTHVVTPTAGTWQFSATCFTTGGGQCQLFMYKNSTYCAVGTYGPGDGNNSKQTINDIQQANGTDTFYICFYSSATVIAQAGTSNTYFSGFRISS